MTRMKTLACSVCLILVGVAPVAADNDAPKSLRMRPKKAPGSHWTPMQWAKRIAQAQPAPDPTPPAGDPQPAAGDPPPARARLFAYPTAESLGIIWAFNGPTPTYPVPSFSEQTTAVDPFRNPETMRVASDIVFLNSFDIQHFRVVHKLKMDLDPDAAQREPHRYRYAVDVQAPEFGTARQDRILWGVNTVTIEQS